MPIDPEQRQHLAAVMEDRRLELRLTWQQVAERGGISLRALSSARTGLGDIRPLTRRGIDKGLQWVEGYGVDSILAGRAPLSAVSGADPTLSEAVRFAVEMGADPDGPLIPYVRAVEQEVERAGEGAAGTQIFGSQPTGEIEAGIWDNSGASPRSNIVIIATLRLDRDRYEAGQRGYGIRGIIGLAPPVTLARR